HPLADESAAASGRAPAADRRHLPESSALVDRRRVSALRDGDRPGRDAGRRAAAPAPNDAAGRPDLLGEHAPRLPAEHVLRRAGQAAVPAPADHGPHPGRARPAAARGRVPVQPQDGALPDTAALPAQVARPGPARPPVPVRSLLDQGMPRAFRREIRRVSSAASAAVWALVGGGFRPGRQGRAAPHRAGPVAAGHVREARLAPGRADGRIGEGLRARPGHGKKEDDARAVPGNLLLPAAGEGRPRPGRAVGRAPPAGEAAQGAAPPQDDVTTRRQGPNQRSVKVPAGAAALDLTPWPPLPSPPRQPGEGEPPTLFFHSGRWAPSPWGEGWGEGDRINWRRPLSRG